jgi:conjugal transfer pilus assembly protein TraV
MKRKSLPDVICLPHGSAANWRPPLTRRRVAAIGGGLLFLAGCTTLGTNINGKFNCGPAGEGSCSPATVIDDRALAEITGDAGYVPAGPYRPPSRDMQPGTVALAAAPQTVVVPGQQKVLRIVFPAHVDRAGRYHETSFVNAVVDNGAWMQASASHGAALAQTVNLTVNPEILSQLGEEVVTSEAGASDSTARIGLNDPRLPSAEAVAAARARASAKAAKGTAGAEGAAAATAVSGPKPFNPVVEQ